MGKIVPDFKWYSLESKQLGLPPRCPFASIHACPRYYESRWKLGNAGSTPVPPETAVVCDAVWKNHPLSAHTAEETTGLSSTEKGISAYHNFCPEVLYDRFGLFATFLSHYADELDRDLAHQRLSSERAESDDPGWDWSAVRRQHFSECPLYSPLSHGWPRLLKNATPAKESPSVKFDVFISHASEDKAPFVRNLAAELARLGLSVWYDESTLKLGDRLREKIDEGLASCSYGVVVLSHSFSKRTGHKQSWRGFSHVRCRAEK